MAKKDLSSLMNGIMGDSSPEPTPQAASNTPGKNEEELSAKLEKIRKQNVGRPRKDEPRAASDEIRATIILSRELLRKLKYISLVESRLLKSVTTEALSSYIDNWENKNGNINLNPKS